jgi:hypothetical protein
MNKYMRLSKKTKIIIVGLCTALGSIFIAAVGTITVAHWFDRNRLVFHAPIEIAFFQPVRVEERKPEIIVERFQLDYPGEIDTPIKKYICDKFGPFECKTALAVFTAESGLREDAFNVNGNGSFDYGIGQVNSIHHKKPGCSMKELVDQYKNVDCAFTIWESSGWGAWVAFNNSNFKTHL